MERMSDKEILRHPYFKNPHLLVNIRAVVRGLFTGQFTLSECLGLMQRKFRNADTQEKFIHLQRLGIEKFVGEGGTVNLYGHTLFPILGDPNELLLHIDQIIRANQYRTDLIRNDDIVIDAGANRGVFSIKAAHEFPNAKIYSFEPVHETFLCLKKNTAPYPNVFCSAMALGAVKNPQMPMTVDPRMPDANSMVDSALDVRFVGGEEKLRQREVRKIPVTTIDDFVADHALPHVDFIKMDVEGYEAKVLNGAVETIRKFKPVIVMSAYHNSNDPTELPKILNRIMPGYRIELEKRNETDLVCVFPER